MLRPRSSRLGMLRVGGGLRLALVSAVVAAICAVSPAHASAATPATIFAPTATPALVDAQDGSAVEVGVKFQSDVAGSISGIRFYKSATNTGVHVGNLWTLAGAKLASATFTGETASGWQQVNFASPVAITAKTIYVASYHTNAGHYSDDIGGFTKQADAPPLHALADGASGVNGVYAYGGASIFPSNGWKASNYWVDVAFNATATVPDTTVPVATISSPANGATVSGTVIMSGVSSDNVGVTSVQVSVDGGTPLPATGTTSWSYSLDTTRLSNASHSLMVSAHDAAGNTGTATETVSIANGTASVLAVDSQVSLHDTSWSPSITSPALSTSHPNELLLAFLTSDGPAPTTPCPSRP